MWELPWLATIWDNSEPVVTRWQLLGCSMSQRRSVINSSLFISLNLKIVSTICILKSVGQCHKGLLFLITYTLYLKLLLKSFWNCNILFDVAIFLAIFQQLLVLDPTQMLFWDLTSNCHKKVRYWTSRLYSF